jgi:hypothetical protein
MIFVPSYLTHRKLDCESAITCVPYCSTRGGHFSSGLAGYIIGHFQQFLKNTCSEFYQLEFWQWILLCVFLQWKKDQGRFRYVGSDHSLVRAGLDDLEIILDLTGTRPPTPRSSSRLAVPALYFEKSISYEAPGRGVKTSHRKNIACHQRPRRYQNII